MRALAVDFGGKRIGLAVGESEHQSVRPLTNIVASGTLRRDAEKIVQVYTEEKAQTVVIGLPLDEQGETRMSKVCRMLGACVQDLGARVAYVDEAMTSRLSERDMAQEGLKGSERRKRSDGEAACRILVRFFEEVP